MNSSPLYLSGLYRSGTTLLSKIIDSSASFNITYGTVHFMRNSFGKYRPIEERYTELVKDTADRINQKWGIDFDTAPLIEKLSETKHITEAVVYDEIMNSFLGIEDQTRWGEKTNAEWEGILPFCDLFPNGKVIHIIRDPRAVLASFKHFTYLPDLMYLDSIFASLAMFNYVEQKNLSKNRQVLLVKYEELVSNPQKVTGEICAFLEIAYTEEMLSLNKDRVEETKPYDANSSFYEKKNIDTTSVEVWKEKLEDWEIYLTEMVLKEKIVRYGYELEAIDLDKDAFLKLFDVLHDDYIDKRYQYWLKHADGQQAFPDNQGAYQ